MKPLNKKSIGILVGIMFASVILYGMNPFQLSFQNRIVLSGLLLTILLWTADIFKKRYVSTLLLLVFLLFGQTEIKTVFRFPLSSDFLMILYAFLFSQGIVNSRVASVYGGKVLNRFGTTPLRLILMGIIFSLFSIFIIPQPFARVILIATLFANYLDEKKISKDVRSTIILSLFIFATVSYMLVRNGDIILNSAMLGFGGVDIGFVDWMRYLTIPTLITGLFIFIAFLLTFRKSIFGVSIENSPVTALVRLNPNERYATATLLIVVALWITEPLHGISPVMTIIAGTLAFYFLGFVKKKDLNVINIDLLFFLTAAFAIGPVMKNTGIAQIVFARLTGIFPANFSSLYIIALVLATMTLHMVLGSTITTLSVVIPGFLQLTAGKLAPVVLMMTTYIAVNIHYLLPFHHVTVMIGSGNGFIDHRKLFRFGVIMSVLVLLSVLFVYFPWWHFIGLI